MVQHMEATKYVHAQACVRVCVCVCICACVCMNEAHGSYLVRVRVHAKCLKHPMVQHMEATKYVHAQACVRVCVHMCVCICACVYE